ncbi:MAG: 50S ribosomal protein L17 [Balneola sp.]|nr:MAG: 50S ribosomal protein L17 [Balneola sp.]
MRHKVKGRKLSRTAAHRRATMRALATALVREHRIVTTVAKAKELRRFIEPLITRAKEDNHLNRKEVFSSLQDKETVKALFAEVGPKAKDRPGGYTRVIKIGFRQGDGAEMAVIELVDFNDIQPEGKTTKKKRTRRTKKSNAPEAATEAATAEATETVVEEEIEAVAAEEEVASEESSEEVTAENESVEEETSEADTEEEGEKK